MSNLYNIVLAGMIVGGPYVVDRANIRNQLMDSPGPVVTDILGTRYNVDVPKCDPNLGGSSVEVVATIDSENPLYLLAYAPPVVTYDKYCPDPPPFPLPSPVPSPS